MSTFYNDNEPYVVEWLKNLTLMGEISPGDVSGASIADIEPWQLAGYTRCHFFAGIAGWEYALKLAGWPEDIVTFTGSCPCQPFSAAGQRKGVNDERHLWPVFAELIRQCLPTVCFGEQVASKDGRLWLAGVQSDFQAMGYQFAAVDTCAAGVGAPHIRQRLYWVAYAEHAERRAELQKHGNAYRGHGFGGGCDVSGLGDSAEPRPLPGPYPGVYRRSKRGAEPERGSVEPRRELSGLGDSDNTGSQGRVERGDSTNQQPVGPSGLGFWTNYGTVSCADGKARRIEPGTFPLVNGVPARVGKLRAYGNAIVPPVAAEFIKSVMDVIL